MTRVLWVHNGDHVFSMWTIGTDGSIASTAAAVPSAGYVPVSLAMDGYGVGRVLMSDSRGDSQIEDLLPDNATSGILMTLPVGHIAGTGLTAGYTGDGLRAWKQTDAGARTYYLYDGSDPIAELDASGTLQAVNTFGAQGLVSRRTIATGASVFYTFDERGNLAQRLDAGGNVLSTDLYDAFGARTGTAAPSDPWGFGAQWGYQTDNETGLVLCTNRYYDPQQGRFLTRDPLGYDGGVNLYGYTQNNPVNDIDPTGYGLEELEYEAQGLPPGARNAAMMGLAVLGAGVIAYGWLHDHPLPPIHLPPIHWPFHNPTQTNIGPSPYSSPSKVVLPDNPAQSPGPDWEWGSRRGSGSTPGDKKGGWHNPKTGESAHPDFAHPPPEGPHWDYKANRKTPKIRIPPGGDPGKCGPGY